jgi:hypothetical protein
MKDIYVNRNQFTKHSSISDWIIDGQLCYYGLEDVDRQRQADGSIIPWTRDLKIPKETAIAYGRYQLITNYSNRFKRVMPLVLGVPDFTGIRVHDGVTAENTEGCLLIGYEKGIDCLRKSDEAFEEFMGNLVIWLSKERVYITIGSALQCCNVK